MPEIRRVSDTHRTWLEFQSENWVRSCQVRFNHSVEINCDTSGEPPAQSPTADAGVPMPEAEPATRDAPSTES